MSAQPDHHHVRRVVLPSGKTIDVVYFGEAEAAGPRPTAAQETVADLHVCGRCESNLVHPIEWSEAGSRHWEVTLRCPNCEWSGTGVFEQELVDRFDEELDRGSEALLRDLERLTQANMQEAVERFVAALAADHIVPADF